jgi:uncharacterized membrane protein YphA (DoxX/SURF4 family)
MMNWKFHPAISLAVRIYLGVIFLSACYHKILHPYNFALDIATYDILPLKLVNLMAITLPWIELLAGLLVIAGFESRTGALAMAGMMALFCIAISIALSKGLNMGCGCFASSEAEAAISWKTLVRDTGWLLLCLYVLVFDKKPLGLKSLRWSA